MRERVEKLFKDYERAFINLKSAIEIANDDLTIDGSIKRFELCFELVWKLMKEYLADLGIICRSPRECFKHAFINGLIEDEFGWMAMIEDRNLLVHTYTFEESREIFERIKGVHMGLLEKFYIRIKGLLYE